jgi:uncharacterized protein YndB with AHSA1/START domain
MAGKGMTAMSTTTMGRTLTKELFIRATPERVWRALTEKAELEQWFLTEALVDVRPGGALRFAWQQDAVVGRFSEIDPPRRLVYSWDEQHDLGATSVTIDLIPEEDGTVLRLVHSGFGSGPSWDATFTGTDTGWSQELENLRVWLETDTPKAWA